MFSAIDLASNTQTLHDCKVQFFVALVWPSKDHSTTLVVL